MLAFVKQHNKEIIMNAMTKDCTITSPSNTFYIGDLCYVLSDEDYDNSVIESTKDGKEDGKYVLKTDENGNELASIHFGTQYGDGWYELADESSIIPEGVSFVHNGFPVDAGIIGICPIELVSPDKIDMDGLVKLGGLLKFDSKDGDVVPVAVTYHAYKKDVEVEVDCEYCPDHDCEDEQEDCYQCSNKGYYSEEQTVMRHEFSFYVSGGHHASGQRYKIVIDS